MKTLLTCNLVSVACVIGAIPIMWIGHDGWGWLLVIALLCHTTPSKE